MLLADHPETRLYDSTDKKSSFFELYERECCAVLDGGLSEMCTVTVMSEDTSQTTTTAPGPLILTRPATIALS